MGLERPRKGGELRSDPKVPLRLEGWGGWGTKEAGVKRGPREAFGCVPGQG